MNTFEARLSAMNWDEERESIYAKTAADVERALQATNCGLDDFKALISPAAAPYLEQMAFKSKAMTQKRFGKVMQMYIPLYLSNACANACVYCGFSHGNDIQRITLSLEQVKQEIDVIKSMGFDHLLLVTGEHPTQCGFEYLKSVIRFVKPFFSHRITSYNVCYTKLLR